MSGMKKYVSTGLLALLTTAYLTSSCSRDDFSGSIIDAKKQAFSENFIAAYGKINPQQDWGFGSSTTRAFTRAVDDGMPDRPTFHNATAITEPENTFVDPAFYTTESQVTDNVTYNNGKMNNLTDQTFYVNGDSNIEGMDSGIGLTIYVVGEVTFTSGTNAARASTIIVTTGSTLHLYALNKNENIYVAPGATLDMSHYKDWSDGGAIKSPSSLTVDNNYIYMGAGSIVTAGNLLVQYAKIINDGATFTANSMQLDNSSEFWNYGTTTITEDLVTSNDYATIYNATGKKITASNLTLHQHVKLWNEGDVDIQGTLSAINEDVKIYNAVGKTIEVKDSLVLRNNDELLVNDGIIDCKGDIILRNAGIDTPAEIVNNGTLDGGSLRLDAGAKFYTESGATTTIDSSTTINNANSEWENNGNYTSESFQILGYGAKVYNNCMLTVEKEFWLNRGKFVMEGGVDGGASVVCNTFKFEDTSNFYMGSKALLKVTGALTTNNHNSSYGFRGFGTDDAVIKAGSIVKGGTDVQYSMTYFGNLYVDAGSHFPQGYIDTGYGQPYYAFDSTVKFSFAEAGVEGHGGHEATASTDYKIAPSSCTPGYGDDSGGGGGDDTTETRVVLKECGRIFCEDLGNVSNRDMDYNDAVFDAWIYVKQTLVNGVVTSESHYRTYIQLLAAGGTIPVDVAGEGEIHKKFGVGQTTMVNTYIPNVSEVREDLCVDKTTLPAEYEIRNGLDYYYARDVDGDGIGDICLKNIPIFVEQGTEATELEAIQGDAPQKYCATLGTLWAGERVQIDWAYTAFMSWVNKIENPWESGVPRNLYSDSGLKRSDGTAYDPLTAHGDEMEYDPNDDPSTTTGEGTGSSTGGNTGGGTSGTSFNNVTGNVVYQTQTQLSSGSGITISSSEFNDAAAADIYIYGTGDGSVEVNGASTEDVSGTSGAPRFGFTRGFGFTRSAETPVVKKCTLGPKQFHGQDIGITGNNFTVYKVSYDPRLPDVRQPEGTVLVSSANGIEMNWAHAGQQKISADRLTGIGLGTIIRVAGVGYADNINSGDNNTSWQVELDVEDPWTKIDVKTYWTENSATGAVTLAFELSGEQAAALLNSQLVVQGVNFILKYVTVDNSNVTPSGGGGGNATATINLVTSTNTITVNNSSTGKIVGDQTTARGYASRIVAGTTRLEGKVKINADDTNTSQYWSYQLGAGNSGNDLIGEVRGDGNNTSNWRTNEEKTINLLLTDNLKQKIDAVVENSWWAGGMFTFQGHNVTLTELKLTNCLPAE
jgi:hypothetical protein